MKFPLAFKDKMEFPANASTCTSCKRKIKNYSFAKVDGGALFLSKNKKDGGPDNRMEGFLALEWHTPQLCEGLDIVSDAKAGQFSIYFCSTKCLRSFLNHAVDKLEERINNSANA